MEVDTEENLEEKENLPGEVRAPPLAPVESAHKSCQLVRAEPAVVVNTTKWLSFQGLAAEAVTVAEAGPQTASAVTAVS